MKEPAGVLALAGEASSAATTAEIEIGARTLAQIIFMSFPFCYYPLPAGVPAGAGFTAADLDDWTVVAERADTRRWNLTVEVSSGEPP